MSFVYPAGLWALLGVLALLAAHFIRRRFAQRTVPSAYLWRLSERFLMRGRGFFDLIDNVSAGEPADRRAESGKVGHKSASNV